MFVHLHLHSQHSTGTLAPRDLVAAVGRLKQPAAAITDLNSMHGAVHFYQRAMECGVKPILGVELDYLAPEAPRCPLAEPPHSECPAGSVIVLAACPAGYASLCRLVTLRQLGGRPLGVADFARHSAGLVALSHALRPLPVWREIFGPRLYVEIRAADGAAAWRRSRTAAESIGLPMAATSPDALRPAAEVRRLFAGFEPALRNTLEIANSIEPCLAIGDPRPPAQELPPGETAFSQLWKLCFTRTAELNRPVPSAMITRLQRRLEELRDRGWEGLYLALMSLSDTGERPSWPALLARARWRFGEESVALIHAADAVVTPGAVSNWVPLEPDAHGTVVTQYDREAIDALGLLRLGHEELQDALAVGVTTARPELVTGLVPARAAS